MIKDKRYTLPIGTITEETENVRTFTFDLDIPAKPGQFIMLTDFNGGEKPFSISDHGKGFLSVTIKQIGEFTGRLFKMKEGDTVSIRGAYGTGFYLPGDAVPESVSKFVTDVSPADFRPVLCGGGFGLPPLYLLAKQLLAAGVPAAGITAVSAGRTEADLLFEKRFIELGIRYIGAAESLEADTGRAPSGGSLVKGTAAAALAELTAAAADGCAPNFVYASGPDLMMKSLIPHMPQDADYQFLFERYMKCAIGICGSCATDPGGIRICKEGPALWRHQVEQLNDFGVYRRTAAGSLDYFTNRLAGSGAGGGQ